MNWEQITSPEFERAVDECGRTCLVPLGVLEKHGDHLPLGQDTIYIHEIATRAAERETAMVFPGHYFGQIHEARHVPGTIAIDGDLLIALLTNVCDEIARNGFEKIILVNGHGGNNALIEYFLQLQLQQPAEYTIYSSSFPRNQPTAAKLLEAKDDGHAGEMETSAMLHLHPELVKLKAFRDYGQNLRRVKHLFKAGLKTGIWWYANQPGHLHGDKVPFTEEKGKAIVEDHVDHVANQIRVVKSDATAPALQREFHEFTQEPANRYP